MSATELAVPMFDCRPGYARLREAIDAAIRDVIASGQLILGPRVRSFENRIVEFLGEQGYAVGVGSGTDALAIALRALEIGAGDEVITVPNTAIPTVSAIRMAGATPVFVDVDPATGLIDVDRIGDTVSSRTRAIVPVHLYGNAVPMEPLREVAARYSLKVVEDCAQSLGTLQGGRATGTFGDIACFSFYPTKNLGAYGDGGLCFTSDPALADAMRQLRMYGCGRTYDAEREGVCSRLDELQAAILEVKLPHLPGWIAARQRVAARYDELLPPEAVRVATTAATRHSRHLYVVRIAHRAPVIEQLRADRIGFGIHYPVPIHRMRAYGFLGYRSGDFPVCERLAEEVLSLPCYPELTMAMVEQVADAVIRGLAAGD